jgi:hypothetical protein
MARRILVRCTQVVAASLYDVRVQVLEAAPTARLCTWIQVCEEMHNFSM